MKYKMKQKIKPQKLNQRNKINNTLDSSCVILLQGY